MLMDRRLHKSRKHRDRRRRGWILGSRAVGKGKKDASVYLLMGFRGIPEVLGQGYGPTLVLTSMR